MAVARGPQGLEARPPAVERAPVDTGRRRDRRRAAAAAAATWLMIASILTGLLVYLLSGLTRPFG